MKKKTFALVVLLLLTLALPAQAVEVRAIQLNPDLYFDGTTAVCSVSGRLENMGDKVEATLTLYQGDNYVDSWNNSATGRILISGSCKVESGKSYKLVLDYSINGTAQLSKTTIRTCP